MIKHLFKFSSKTITSAALLLGGASFLSRILGLIRARIFAYQLGAGIELDMYYAAFRVPDLIFSIIIMGAVSSAFIPIFTAERLKNKKDSHWLLANNFLHVFSFLVLILALVLVAIAPYLVKAIAPGFDLEAQRITVILTRIMLIQPVILAISGIIAGILQSFNLFFAYALSPIMYNIGIISGALFFAPKLGIKGLAIGVVLGAFLHLLIQIPSLISAGYRYHFHINLKDKMMRKIVKLTIPRSLGLATVQLNTIVITAIASTLAIGSIAIFNYANDIQCVPLGLIGIAYAAAAFPTLSAAFARKDLKSFRVSVTKTLLEIIYLVIPVTILFFLLRNEITNVLLHTGAFSNNDVRITAALIGIFCVGIPFQSLIPLLSRAFFALHNTITPVIINLISVGINISLALFLVRNYQVLNHFNVPGDKRILALPLAFVLSGILNVILLFFFLLKKIGFVSIKKFFSSFFSFIILNLGLFVLVYSIRNFSYQYFNQENIGVMFFVGLITGVIGLLAYFSLSYILKIKELKSILKVFKK